MTDVEYLQKIIHNIKEAEKEVHPSDIKFHQVFQIPLMANKLMSGRCFCEQCQILLDKLHETSERLVYQMNEQTDGKKQLDNLLHTCRKHLLKHHKITLKNYYTSLYTFYGILTGIFIILFINHYVHHLSVEIDLLLVVIIAVVLRIFGKYFDNKQKKSGKQL